MTSYDFSAFLTTLESLSRTPDKLCSSSDAPQTHPRNSIIFNRQVVFCPHLRSEYDDDIFTTCPFCGSYHAICCPHDTRNGLQRIKAFSMGGIPCHLNKLAMIDGCCLNNGSSTAIPIAGLGISTETGPKQQFSILVTAEIDGAHPRTSQRAELLAAIKALDILAAGTRIEEEEQEEELALEKRGEGTRKRHGNRNGNGDGITKTGWVLRTDSEYVFKGVTVWYPTWKKNDWRTTHGKSSPNLDLFHTIDRKILGYEEAFNVQIGIWKVGREDNREADKLAKEAAKSLEI